MDYTHIVVGAGSAGCIVAARTAENSNFNVLLLEAGPDIINDDAGLLIGVKDSRRVPMQGQSDLFEPSIDWDVEVALADGGSMRVPQARVVGGGSSINGGIALRNTLADSREWVELGNDAWNFDSVYQAYQNLEGDRLRSTDGPHPVTRATRSELGKIQRAFLDGAKTIGFLTVEDLNATGTEGTGPSPVCRDGHRRISAANTFIDPIRGKSNFTIRPNSQVDKILFSNKRACAVLLVNGISIQASNEIIICAGSMFSPAIVQRSGIGPARLMESIGVALVSDLPVGENLSDHPCIPVVAKPRVGVYQDGDYSLQMQTRWSSAQKPGAIDLQMICFSYLYAQAVDPSGQARSLGGTAAGHVAGIGCMINKPTSVGHVTIRSKNASVYPVVMPNYLHTADDLEAAREAVRCAYRVITSPAMREVLEEPLTLTPDMIAHDEVLDKWINTQYSSTYHFTGSCRMASTNRGGVVDQSGRVYGVEGLRVADASIIPTIPAGNTMLTTMMFADRIGRSIRDGRDVKALRGFSKL